MKTIVVTGISGGLGHAIGIELLDAEYRVIGISRRPVTKAMLERSAISDDRFAHISADLSDIEEIPALVRQIVKDHGPIYGLVNNAGIGFGRALATQHHTEINTLIRTNLLAPIYLSKYILRSMLVAGEGRIVNISSIIARSGFSSLSVYGATKAGLEGFTKSLAREVGRVGITVNCVAPGFVETEMTDTYSESEMASIKRRSPLGLASPAHIAAAVSYFLDVRNSKTTGTTLVVDGGSTA